MTNAINLIAGLNSKASVTVSCLNRTVTQSSTYLKCSPEIGLILAFLTFFHTCENTLCSANLHRTNFHHKLLQENSDHSAASQDGELWALTNILKRSLTM